MLRGRNNLVGMYSCKVLNISSDNPAIMSCQYNVQTVEGGMQLSRRSCFNKGKQGRIYGGRGAEAPPPPPPPFQIIKSYP